MYNYKRIRYFSLLGTTSKATVPSMVIAEKTHGSFELQHASTTGENDPIGVVCKFPYVVSSRLMPSLLLLLLLFSSTFAFLLLLPLSSSSGKRPRSESLHNFAVPSNELDRHMDSYTGLNLAFVTEPL